MSTVHVWPVDVFAPRFRARVVPVNCVGVMGAGLAKAAARRFPDLYPLYQAQCDAGRLRPGDVATYPDVPGVVLAATKDHWRDPSRGSWVLACCEALADLTFNGASPSDIAVPALGCGLGGLSWDAHVEAIKQALQRGHKAATFYLSPPQGPGAP